MGTINTFDPSRATYEGKRGGMDILGDIHKAADVRLLPVLNAKRTTETYAKELARIHDLVHELQLWMRGFK